MAFKKLGDLMVSVGDKQDGKGKFWTKVGIAFQDDEGNISMKLEVLPMPKVDERTGYPCVWVKVFQEREGQGQGGYRGGGGRPSSRPAQNDPLGDDDAAPL